MNSTTVVCPKCGGELELPADIGNRRLQCPYCDVKFKIEDGKAQLLPIASDFHRVEDPLQSTPQNSLKKFKVMYCECGEEGIRGHRDEWCALPGEYNTREEAVAALKNDMLTYKKQWSKEGIGAFQNDGWWVSPLGSVLDFAPDASCEWDVVEVQE